jgi:hypothetical protein
MYFNLFQHIYTYFNADICMIEFQQLKLFQQFQRIYMYFNVSTRLYFNTFVFQRIWQYMFQHILYIFQYER